MTSSQQLTPFVFPETSGQIRVVEIGGDPWFVAADVCREIGIVSSSHAVRDRLDADEYQQVVPNGCSTDVDGSRPPQRPVNVVSESGMYSLILWSTKPEAKRFKKWITSEVLPQIRKTGSYVTEYQSPAHRILAMAQAAVDHEERLAELARHAEEVDRRMYISEARLDSIEHNAGTYTVLAYAKLCGVTVSSAEAVRLGKAATALYRQRVDMEPAKVRDERYGLVNLYPENMLQEVFQDFGFMLRSGGGLVAR